MNFDYDAKQNDELLIEEIKDLLNIPLMKKIMVHKFEELKLLLSEDIDHYKQIKRLLHPNLHPDFSGKTEFQLNRLGKSLWIPSFIPPQKNGKNKSGREISLLLPKELINFMVNQGTSPGLIVSKRGFTLEELPGRVFSISFERLSDNLITGIVDEQNKPDLNASAPQKEPFNADNSVDMKTLHRFFNYLLKNKVLYKRSILPFLFIWKHLIDEQREKAVSVVEE